MLHNEQEQSNDYQTLLAWQMVQTQSLSEPLLRSLHMMMKSNLVLEADIAKLQQELTVAGTPDRDAKQQQLEEMKETLSASKTAAGDIIEKIQLNMEKIVELVDQLRNANPPSFRS
jgi:hypothetical protein